MQRTIKGSMLAAAVLLALSAPPALAQDKAEAQDIVDKAAQSVGTFATDPNMSTFRDYAGRAKGLLVVPTMVKGGFLLGGSGGSGVLLARRDKGKAWSHPAFYTLGSVTFGLQIGGEVSELVLLVMTERGMRSLLQSSAKLGGDVSVAAGPVGAGAKAATADILAFSRTKGLYGGINVEGAILDVRDDWNGAYYGAKPLPDDILIKRTVDNDGAGALRKAVAKAAAGKS
jgi:lipid-binding SYLF domain-containing protein